MIGSPTVAVGDLMHDRRLPDLHREEVAVDVDAAVHRVELDACDLRVAEERGADRPNVFGVSDVYFELGWPQVVEPRRIGIDERVGHVPLHGEGRRTARGG